MIENNILKAELQTHNHGPAPLPPVVGSEEVGRNDECPCGSQKKWKKCGMLNTEEHQSNLAKK